MWERPPRQPRSVSPVDDSPGQILTPFVRTVFNLSAYLPDAVVPQYEALRDQLVSLLQILGLAQSKTDAAAGSYPRD